MSDDNSGEEVADRFAPAGRQMFALIAGLFAIIVAAGAFAIIGPARGETAPGAEVPGALETFAGIPPVAYLVKRIGGPHVRVEVLVHPGQDPHVFEPTPRQVVRLGRARLFFKIGMPFEDRLTDRLSGGGTQVVDTTVGIARRTENDADEQYEEGAEEEHSGLDPHVWLAPRLLKQMAANIAAALAAADPPHETEFRANLAALDSELGTLDRRLAASLAPYRGQAFYVFHPAFGYFADAYGLRQESVEVEGKQPTSRQLYRMVQRARAEGVKIIFLQPQFNRHAAASIAAALGGAVMPMDSLAYDVVRNLEDVAAKIAAAGRNREHRP